ncbi:hypothetical protein [Halomarina litorea]|uniref:hypothetical protein n=1 Tax=Halomarina litorea TaxID=2961595 RepID=UPI0020C369AE|nr:hypothetical protein [Halomarina sp. BCD28]
MTDDTRRNGRDDEYRPTLGEMSHTNPQTGESFGDAMVYRRGPTVAADGGEAEAVPADAEEAAESDQLKDVDHTPARGDVDVNRVHERGGEATTGDDVEE